MIRAFLLAAFLAGGSVATAAPVRLPDGRFLNLDCRGKGAPTVVFESGWGGDSRAWGRVRALLGDRRRHCAYDRAGYGLSDPGPMPRDGTAVARDLADALREARVEGPLLLVGHSAGGLTMRLLADRLPSRVMGLVLVDPTVEHQDRQLSALLGPGAGTLAPLIARERACLRRDPAGPNGQSACPPLPSGSPPIDHRTRLSELETLFGPTSDAAARGGAGWAARVPVVVLTAARTYPQPQAAAAWAELHRRLAARFARGRARIVPDSGHLMMNDRPDVVAGAVEEVAAGAPPR